MFLEDSPEFFQSFRQTRDAYAVMFISILFFLGFFFVFWRFWRRSSLGSHMFSVLS